MTLSYIVLEGNKNQEILEKLLPENLIQDVKIIVGDSQYEVRSLASSLLATRNTPVILVLDADTDNESQIFEKQDLINYLLRRASSGIPFQVSLAVPQIEIILIQDKSLIEKIAQRQFNDLEWKFAQSKPKEFLETVLGKEQSINERIFSNINDEEIKILQQHPLIQEIMIFLSSLTTSSVAI
ncbi:hypothetical protein H6G54_10330 [Anabaena cylindrica FACHB-243]|uniref:Uncharacterized protein n=1 Tax=Anabaena cylindrica (strain ATCC 27899 / PCC 7122) TaxID=272123 RepID=K9ZB73_ANACC|nr:MULTISPECIES: hypothetical protein [Anabaena]AFZ56453.1 hypothetical protein Anacy_0876 [Anabaena cylindrica PCC 7122]MBD2418097.1 hypothetical protein [Anabaena cylindrica FACHB-243]MBY5281942.1 hypothetical protein [Anabaena sp. CCAP 1446/1C]MBY5310844.1 hypothetical protein [Anabaena sp. CCAP 1446/1C]MCM2407374.1 hypothetical protein [Anabaena sp. CCAP 1446/1C]